MLVSTQCTPGLRGWWSPPRGGSRRRGVLGAPAPGLSSPGAGRLLSARNRHGPVEPPDMAWVVKQWRAEGLERLLSDEAREAVRAEREAAERDARRARRAADRTAAEAGRELE